MNGWTFVTIEGNMPWGINQYQGNHYAYANGYGDDVANEHWCISPAFNLNIYSNASLTFRNAMKFTGPDLELYFSNDYDGENPSSATWTELTYVMSEGNYVWTESGVIDLANFTANARAAINAARSYQHFSNESAETVKFIIKTPSIK